MIGLLQRVTRAHVAVGDQRIGAIDNGLLVLVGVRAGDDEGDARRLIDRVLGYRVFADGDRRMNRSLIDTGGGLLLVPQFTLAADTGSGMRPGFSTAAPAGRAADLFAHAVAVATAAHSPVASGRFGADMQVHLINDGPVTFWLET